MQHPFHRVPSFAVGGSAVLFGARKRSVKTFPLSQIKQVRLVLRADGYYVQFAVKVDRKIDHAPTDHVVGIDVGLKSFYTDSDGQTIANPRFSRKAEQKLKRLHRHVSRKKKGSKNRKKAIKRLARGHQKASRRRKDFAIKQASALVKSSDLIAYEHLHIKNMVKNRHLAKSIHDAGWGMFLGWVRYYGTLHHVPVVAMPAAYTSQDCSGCGFRVWKSLSIRTHICPNCGLVLDRDHNSAVSIRDEGIRTWGHRLALRSQGKRTRDAPWRTLRDRRPLRDAGNGALASRLADRRIPSRKRDGECQLIGSLDFWTYRSLRCMTQRRMLAHSATIFPRSGSSACVAAFVSGRRLACLTILILWNYNSPLSKRTNTALVSLVK